MPVPSFQSYDALNAHLEQRCLEQPALVEVALGVGGRVLGQGLSGNSGWWFVCLIGEDGGGPGAEDFQGRVQACVLLELVGQQVQGFPVALAGAFSFQGG